MGSPSWQARNGRAERSGAVPLHATAAELRVHTAQLLSYLSAAGLRLGMLMNFNVPRMVHGVKRVVR